MNSILNKSLIIIISLLIILVLSIYTFIQTNYFKKILVSTINSAVNSAIDQEFKISGIEGNIISNITFRDIELIVDEKPLLKIDELSTEYSLPLLISVLFRGDIPLNNTKLIGTEINLYRNPNGIWNFDRIKEKDKKDDDNEEKKGLVNLYLNNSYIDDLVLTVDDDTRDDYLEFNVFDSSFSIDLIGLYKKFNLISDDINADFNKLDMNARNLKMEALITKDNIVFKNLDTVLNGFNLEGQGVVNNFGSPEFRVSAYIDEYQPNNLGTLNFYIKTNGKMYETNNIIAEADLSFINSNVKGERIWTSLDKIKMNGTRITINGDVNTDFGRAYLEGFVDLNKILSNQGVNQFNFQTTVNDLLIKHIFEIIENEPDFLIIDDSLKSDSTFNINGSWTKGSDFSTDLDISDIKIVSKNGSSLKSSGLVSIFKDHLIFDLDNKTENFIVSSVVPSINESVLLNSLSKIKGMVPYENAGDNIDVTITGEFNGSKIYGFNVLGGDINTTYQNKILNIESLDIASDFFNLKADGKGNDQNGLNLNFVFDSKDLRFVSGLYEPLSISGRGEARGTLTGNIDSPVLTADASFKNFQYKDDLFFSEGKADVLINFSNDKVIDINSKFSNIEYKNIDLIRLKLKTKTEGTNLIVNMDGDFTESNNILSEFTVLNYTENKKTIESDSLVLHFDDQKISNNNPIKIVLSPNKVDFQSFLLSNDDSNFNLAGHINYNNGSSNFQASITNLDSSLVSDMMSNDTEFKGETDIKIDVEGSLRNPKLNLQLNSQNLHINEFITNDLSISINSNNGKTNIDFREKDGDNPYSIVVGEIYSGINFYDFRKLLKSKLNLKVNLNSFDISPLIFLNRNIKQLYGNISSNLILSGSILNPYLDGSLEIKNLGIIALPLLNILEVEDMTVVIKNNYTKYDNIIVKSKSGTAEVSGTADLNNFVYNFDTKLNNIYIKHPNFSTKLTGEIKLLGIVDNLDIDGKVTMNNLKVEVRNRYEQKKFSDIKYVDDLSYEQLNTEKENEIDFFTENVALNVEIEIPSNTWLSGMGAKVSIKGDLTFIKDYRKDQVISGTINTERGQYTAFGRSFNIEKGFINFPSITEFNPQIDLTATYEIHDTEIFINLIGTAEKPNLNLSSSPPMDKSDIISLMIFGTSSANLGSSQRNVSQELASNLAMGELAGIIAPQFGLDVLSVQGSEEGGYSDPQVKVGSYIDDNLYVGYERTPSQLAGASTDPEDKVKVEYKINRSFSVESLIGGENSGADVFYNFDF